MPCLHTNFAFPSVPDNIAKSEADTSMLFISFSSFSFHEWKLQYKFHCKPKNGWLQSRYLRYNHNLLQWPILSVALFFVFFFVSKGSMLPAIKWLLSRWLKLYGHFQEKQQTFDFNWLLFTSKDFLLSCLFFSFEKFFSVWFVLLISLLWLSLWHNHWCVCVFITKQWVKWKLIKHTESQAVKSSVDTRK